MCHRHRVGGYRVKRLSALGLALSEIKRYVQRVLGLDAGKAQRSCGLQPYGVGVLHIIEHCA